MAIDYRTAAALSQNIAGIGNMFMQMNDPATRAKAALVGNQNALLGAQVEGQKIDNQYAPGKNTATIFATNANGTQSLAAAGLADEQKKHWQGRVVGQQRMLESTSGGGGGLDSLDDAFNAAGAANGIDPRVLKSIAMLETGNGTSSAFLQKKNAMGVSDANGPISFNDPVESINRMARVLADPNGPYKGKQTLAEIGGVYAPPGAGNDPNGTNGGWGSNVSKFYQQLGGDPASSIFKSGQIQPARPLYSEADMQRLAVNAAVSSDSDANVIQNIARASGLFATTPMEMNQAALGVTGIPAVYNTDANNATALDKAAVEEETKKQIAVFSALVDGTGTGTGTGTRSGTGGNSFAGAKEIGESTLARFSLDGETITEQDRPKAQAYAASVSTLTSQGVPFEVAKNYADQHHGLPTTEDGLFSSPQMNYDKFNPAPITPEQAAQVAAQFGGGAGSPAREANVMRYAQIFGGTQPATEQVAATQPTTVATQRPADPVPQTGVAKPPGRVLGAEREKAEKQKGMDEGTAYNEATLGNILRAAKAEGVPIEDILATVSTGGEINDDAIARIFATSKGLGILKEGGRSPNDLRNALKDGRALNAANLDPAQIRSYFQSNAPAAQPQSELTVQQIVDQYRTR